MQFENLFVVQNKNYYCFSSDSVALANFAKPLPTDFVVEFCSGCGVISFLIDAKCNPKKIVGFEMDKALFDLSQKSSKLNNLTNIEFKNLPLETAIDCLGKCVADVVVCNPPYFVPPKNVEKISAKYLSTKYETTTNLAQIVNSAKKILKQNGKFFVVFPSIRFAELLEQCAKQKLFLKTIQPVCYGQQANCEVVLCEFVKGKKQKTIFLQPMFL